MDTITDREVLMHNKDGSHTTIPYLKCDQAYKYLGDLYEKNRDLVKALENWQIYATKDENSGIDVYHKIESALFDLGRYSEVEKFYQKLISLDKFNLEAIIKLANVYEEKGEINTALTLVENISDKIIMILELI